MMDAAKPLGYEDAISQPALGSPARRGAMRLSLLTLFS